MCVLYQRTLVPNLKTWPIFRNGHKLRDWVFGIGPISRVKADIKNYNQHFIKHDEDNNSKF